MDSDTEFIIIVFVTLILIPIWMLVFWDDD